MYVRWIFHMVNNKRNFQYAFYVDGQLGNKGGDNEK